MIFVKSIFAGLVALAGAIMLLLLLALVVVPILVQLLGGIGIDLGPGGYVLAGVMAVAIFCLGFGWEYRRVKARQAN
jgi:type IV secretory pathway TrbL component